MIPITNRKFLINSAYLFYVIYYYFPVKTNWLFFLSFFIQGERLNRMNQAAKYFLLQAIENGTWVGMVHFDSSASIKSELIQIISTNERNQLLNSLPPAAGGGTSICAGIDVAFQVNLILHL